MEQSVQEELRAAAWALVAGARLGALGTLEQPSGHPYTSLVEVCPQPESQSVLLLLSALAEHTINLMADTRATLLITDAWGTPAGLAHERVTLVGEALRIEDAAEVEAARASFLAVHPHAGGYARFKDFSMWRLRVQRARYIAGFGRMGWV
jgi:putative heme iron utilization protein